MQRLMLLLILLAAWGLLGCQQPNQHPVVSGLQTAQAKYLIRFKSTPPAWLKPHLLRPVLQAQQLYLLSAESPEWAERLRQLPEVMYLEPNQSWQVPSLQPHTLPAQLHDLASAFQLQDFKPNDTFFARQWNFEAISMPKAWELQQSAEDIIVAVIDSGVDPDHPDLQSHLLPVEDIWQENIGADQVINRLTRESFDFSGRDGHGHGTHVAGIIAGLLNNQEGIAGIAGGGVKVLPIKVANLEGATESDLVIAGIQRAIEKNARVINLSLGSVSARRWQRNQALEEAVQLAYNKGIVLVAATGNESTRSKGNVANITIPAAYPEVIAVGAFNQARKVADYSNGGSEIELLAPGGDRSSGAESAIFSSWPTYPTFANLTGEVEALSYAATTGTSMAAPHVSGVVALMLAREPQLTPEQVRARLLATADDTLKTGFDLDSGYGLLNAYKALFASGNGSAF